MKSHEELNFALTAVLKITGIAEGYKARREVAPRAKTFMECSLKQKNKILELLNARAQVKNGVS